MIDKEINILEELIQNTTNVYLNSALKEAKRNIEDKVGVSEDIVKINNCVSYISENNFNINGWELREIPTEYSHCFYNESKNEMFDLCVFKIGEVVPYHLNSSSNEIESKSIEDSIKEYSIY